MKLIFLLGLVAVVRSATILPVDSSSVSVKHSGKDFSYSIHQNQGIAIEPNLAVIPQHTPIVSAVHPVEIGGNLIAKLQTRDKVEKMAQPATEAAKMPLQRQAILSEMTLPIAAIPAMYNYLPVSQQYALNYALPGIRYPMNIISI